MSEEAPLQQEIRALLRQVEARSVTVMDLARDCLKQYRKECGLILEWYQTDVAAELLETGSVDYDERSNERDERLTDARMRLKERLENLLKTSEAAGF